MLSMTTDYANVSTGCPEPYLRRIAEAGFTHIHWCHQWNTDFLYAACEIEQIARWLRDLGLTLTDLHASAGVEKNWGSVGTHSVANVSPYERLAGVELVSNRIEMAARLGSDVIIMHFPAEPAEPGQREPFWARMRTSLDALEPLARRRGVRIAIENMAKDNFDTLERVFALYGPDFVGLCYDSGHGNVAGLRHAQPAQSLSRGGNGLDRLERVKGRLLSLHLHDNDGSGDQHKLPFDGTVDWPRLARLIAQSPYAKPVSMESNLGSYPEGSDEMEHLRKGFEAGTRLAEMLGAARLGLPSRNSSGKMP